MRQAAELIEERIGRGDAGFVFDLPGRNRPATDVGKKTAVDWVSKKISARDKAAGVVTKPEKGCTATAHDLRRSFGYCWARGGARVHPHEDDAATSIATSLTYDDDLDDATAAHQWDIAGGAS